MKKKYYFPKLAFYLTFLFFVIQLAYTRGQVPEITIVTDKVSGQPVYHGLAKIEEVLQQQNISFERVSTIDEAHGKSVIVAGLAAGEGTAAQLLKGENRTLPEGPESLTIWQTSWKEKPVWAVAGSDDRGLMYGLLDMADRLSWRTDPKTLFNDVKVISEKPALAERAVSVFTMNRTYWESRFYDEAYWERYLDMLAKNRFNSLVVIFGYENGGFLAPCYPYFFNVEEFPEVRMVGIKPAEQERNLAAFNHLVKMAHDRGIRVNAGIWDHIYRGGVQGGGIPGSKDVSDQPVAGLVWGVTTDNLTDYTKKALAKFVKLIPDLDGIQFRMHNESGLKEGEQDGFWSDVFQIMKTTAPHLLLDLRAKELPESVIQSALKIGVNFRITTKFWMEQMGMPYHPTQVNPDNSPVRHSYASLLRYPQQYKMNWQLWNGGTNRILLWGNPDYVRRFAESTHLYDGDGFEINEPLATKMEAQPHDAKPFELLNAKYHYYDWEFERYWHFYQVFGRIGYNAHASADIWDKEFEHRFGTKAAPILEKALHQASWVLPRIITSSYPYTSFPMTRGWAEKQALGDLPTFAQAELSDLAQFANFDEEAQIRIEGGETAKILPSANSRWFLRTSEAIDKLIAEAEKAKKEKQGNEWLSTITDLKILSSLALYHSRRIPAAVNYRIFERTSDVAALDEAILQERAAIDAWRRLVTAAGDVYAADLMLGVCVADLCGHWKDELVFLERGLKDLEEKRKMLPVSSITASTNASKAILVNGASSNVKDDYPFQVEHQPVLSVPINQPIHIRIKVKASAGIKSVNLRYRSVNQELEYQRLPMQPAKEKDVYEVMVPAVEINPTWDFMYYIEMMDNQGAGRIYPDLNKETPYKVVKLIRE